jgi:polar amino acid transport system permease protein
MDFATHLSVIKILFFRGLIPTLQIMPVTIAVSLLIGTLGGVLRFYKVPVLHQVLGFYISVVRGTPILLLYFISYFVIFVGRQDPELATIVTLVVYNAGYVIEIVKGGLQAVDKGQKDAAKSIAMSGWQSLYYIVLPQSVLVIAPALVGQLMLLIKSTALASAIGFVEITRTGTQLMQTLKRPLEVYFYVALFYFVLCHLLKLTADKLEERSCAKIIGRPEEVKIL